MSISEQEHQRRQSLEDIIQLGLNPYPSEIFIINSSSEEIKNNLVHLLGEENINFIPTTTIANKILGDSITANLFIIGLAYQSGLIRITSNSIEKSSFFIPGTAKSISKESSFSIVFTEGTE